MKRMISGIQNYALGKAPNNPFAKMRTLVTKAGRELNKTQTDLLATKIQEICKGIVFQLAMFNDDKIVEPEEKQLKEVLAEYTDKGKAEIEDIKQLLARIKLKYGLVSDSSES